jgi:hypothetical protein
MTSKPPLIQELQFAALDRTIPTDDLLRMALVAAKKLRVREFEEWLSCELEGYGVDVDLRATCS